MFRATSRFSQFTAMLALALVFSLSALDIADARRAGGFGGFGSRGSRTHQAPAPTRTAPNTAAPIERSMTPNTGTQTGTQAARPAQGAAAANAAKPGLFGGFGRSMLGGLLVGGLIGMMLGNGLGGMAGMLGLLLQMALIAGLAMLAMRYFANRNKPALATVNARNNSNNNNNRRTSTPQFGAGQFGARNNAEHNASSQPSRSAAAETPVMDDAAPVMAEATPVEATPLAVGQEDLEHFETMLREIQTAYGEENYATLRQLSTPEAMSYLAEELGETATQGLRNQVSDIKLLQGDISEGWSEDGKDFATVAMRYSSIDYMVDRNSGDITQGDDQTPVESIEVWTFTRPANGRVEDWKLAAIQAA